MSNAMPAAARARRWFDESPERIFDAWLSPELIGKWMFGRGIRDEAVLRIEVDARVGGRFAFVVRRQSAIIEHVGRYVEIDRPRRLVFTWAVGAENDASRVEIDLIRLENGTDLTLTHHLAPDWAGRAADIEASWMKMLDALDLTLTELAE